MGRFVYFCRGCAVKVQRKCRESLCDTWPKSDWPWLKAPRSYITLKQSLSDVIRGLDRYEFHALIRARLRTHITFPTYTPLSTRIPYVWFFLSFLCNQKSHLLIALLITIYIHTSILMIMALLKERYGFNVKDLIDDFLNMFSGFF